MHTFSPLARKKKRSTHDHTRERILKKLYGQGWLAKLAYQLGLQHHVGVTRHYLELSSEYDDRPPLRLAFASDFHAGPVTHRPLLIEVCQTLARAEPDVLLLGGDFVSFHARYVDELAGHLAQIPARLGRFAVLGNHDIWADERYVTRRLEAAGVQMLVNQNVQLPAPFDHVWICGLDEMRTGEPNPARMFCGARGTRIVLMHSPDALRAIYGDRFDLALCGHTHGGQIALPGGIPLLLPSGRLCRPYARGSFRVGNRGHGTMIVSRGVGYSGLPVRLFADPEVHLCTVKWQETGTSGLLASRNGHESGVFVNGYNDSG